MDVKNLLLCLVGISCILPYVFARKAIIGGQLADPPVYYRYQVSILVDDHLPSCGGGIINNDSIITSAHCIIAANGELRAEPIFVITNTHKLGKGSFHEVRKVNLPPDFRPELHNSPGDLAVLKLKTPLNMAAYQLRKLVLTRDRPLTNRTATIAGFGWDMINHNKVGTHSDQYLRYVEALILDNDQCLNEHPAINNTLTRFCARAKQLDERKGTCHGDEGGPLVEGKIVYGVLSKVANNCWEKTSSAIYTRISHYRFFIKSAIEDKWTVNQRIIHDNIFEFL